MIQMETKTEKMDKFKFSRKKLQEEVLSIMEDLDLSPKLSKTKTRKLITKLEILREKINKRALIK